MANKFITLVPLEGFTSRQFYMLCSNALSSLGWQHNISDDEGIKASTGTSMSSWGEEITIKAENNIVEIKSACSQWQITDWGKNKKNINKLLSAIDSAKQTTTAEALEEQAYQLQKETEQAVKEFNERRDTGQLTATEKMLVEQGRNYVTYAIIALNVLVFVAMCIFGADIFAPSAEDIVKWGGNFRVLTLSGDWWRLITCVFVHIGIIHIAFNMYALYFIGLYLEPILGKTKYFLVYLCTGILSSVVSIWWSGERVSAGASGAIFGLYGVFLALLTTSLIDKETRKSLLQSILVFVLYNLAYGMKGGIDNAAHIGGLVSGFVLGYCLYLGMKDERKSNLTTIGMVVLTLFITAGYLKTGISDEIVYQKNLEEFAVFETKALQPLKEQEGKSQNELIQELKSISLPAWKEAKLKIDNTLKLTLSEKLAKQRGHFRDYTNLRVRETELFIITATDTSQHYIKELNNIETSLIEVTKLIKEEK